MQAVLLVVCVLLMFPVGLAGGAYTDSGHECGGLAPLESACTSGNDSVGHFWFQGFSMPPCPGSSAAGVPVYCFVGRLESTVETLDGSIARTLSCDAVAYGARVSFSECFESGPYAANTKIRHRCTATAISIGLVPLGLGAWGCYLVG